MYTMYSKFQGYEGHGKPELDLNSRQEVTLTISVHAGQFNSSMVHPV